jgi:hypothetical protein
MASACIDGPTTAPQPAAAPPSVARLAISSTSPLPPKNMPPKASAVTVIENTHRCFLPTRAATRTQTSTVAADATM